jgi:hypothetical protein
MWHECRRAYGFISAIVISKQMMTRVRCLTGSAEGFSSSSASTPFPLKHSTSAHPFDAGIVSKFGSMPGMIGMHGGLPPSDSFPFSYFNAGISAAGYGPTDAELQIVEPQLVSAAQQYNMNAQVSRVQQQQQDWCDQQQQKVGCTQLAPPCRCNGCCMCRGSVMPRDT